MSLHPACITCLEGHKARIKQLLMANSRFNDVMSLHGPDIPGVCEFLVQVSLPTQSIPDLYNALLSQGIAATIKCSGVVTHIRFTPDGQSQCLDYIEEEYGIAPEDLIDIIEQTPRSAIRLAKLEATIREHATKVIPLSWDNQEYLGKRYLMAQAVKSPSPA